MMKIAETRQVRRKSLYASMISSGWGTGALIDREDVQQQP
jgi:hypothetical protein